MDQCLRVKKDSTKKMSSYETGFAPSNQIQTMTRSPITAPSLCDALGLESDSFDRFLTRKDQAHAQKEAKAEQRAREALLAKLVWAE